MKTATAAETTKKPKARQQCRHRTHPAAEAARITANAALLNAQAARITAKATFLRAINGMIRTLAIIVAAFVFGAAVPEKTLPGLLAAIYHASATSTTQAATAAPAKPP